MSARIAYVSWPAGEITGGIKAAFQHVELLREAGFDAFVATEDARPPGWFDTSAPVAGLEAMRQGDVLVFPENNPRLLERFASWNNRKVVFCQNPWYVHLGLAGRASFSQFGVSALLGPSLTALQFCARRFPDLPCHYTPFYVDPRRFAPAPKKLQVACLPRKRGLEAGAVLDLVRAQNPRLAAVPWVILKGVTETQVAQALGESAVYLSLQRYEAHGMTSLEAMASGCLVAGFAGVAGGSDSATAANGFWAPEDDILACADRLGHALAAAAARGPLYEEMLRQGRDTAARYGREDAARQLVAVWRQLLGG